MLIHATILILCSLCRSEVLQTTRLAWLEQPCAALWKQSCNSPYYNSGSNPGNMCSSLLVFFPWFAIGPYSSRLQGVECGSQCQTAGHPPHPHRPRRGEPPSSLGCRTRRYTTRRRCSSFSGCRTFLRTSATRDLLGQLGFGAGVGSGCAG